MIGLEKSRGMGTGQITRDWCEWGLRQTGCSGGWARAGLGTPWGCPLPSKRQSPGILVKLGARGSGGCWGQRLGTVHAHVSSASTRGLLGSLFGGGGVNSM